MKSRFASMAGLPVVPLAEDTGVSDAAVSGPGIDVHDLPEAIEIEGAEAAAAAEVVERLLNAADPAEPDDEDWDEFGEDEADEAEIPEEMPERGPLPLGAVLTVTAGDIIAACADAVRSISNRNINPVLGYFELVTCGGKLRVTGTDGDYRVTRWCECAGELSEAVLVPAKLLLDSLKRFAGTGAAGKRKEITLSTAPSPCGGHPGYTWEVTISAGTRSLKLAGLAGVNYPQRGELTADQRLITVSGDDLKHWLNMVLFASVKESCTGGVHYTNGIYLALVNGGLDLVATDGHRLALSRNDGLPHDWKPEEPAGYVIPARAAEVLEKMLPKTAAPLVEVYATGKWIAFRWEGVELFTLLLDVKFPDYMRVIPNDIDSRLHVRREELIDALGAALLVCRQKDQDPVCRFEYKDGALCISSDASEIGTIEERIDCELAGESFKVALNPAYVLDVCKHALSGEQVTLNWVWECNPVLVTSPREPGYSYIVMPIRLD